MKSSNFSVAPFWSKRKSDLLIEQEVLKLLFLEMKVQLQLLFLMMNRLFTCKIKEHNEI